MRKRTQQTGLFLSMIMLATTSLWPVSVYAEETTEAAVAVVSEETDKADAKTLMEGNWAPATRARIQAVIDANAGSGRYVVFDFDNTSAIFDVEEALLAYQIENLEFKIAPENLARRSGKLQIPTVVSRSERICRWRRDSGKSRCRYHLRLSVAV